MLRNVCVTYVSFLPIYSSVEYVGIVIFSTTTLGLGVLLVARIVRLIQAEPDSMSYSLYRCFESLLVRDAMVKTPTWQVVTKNTK